MSAASNPPSQALIALMIAGSLLGPGALLAFAVSRFTAWYARRWRTPRDGD